MTSLPSSPFLPLALMDIRYRLEQARTSPVGDAIKACLHVDDLKGAIGVCIDGDPQEVEWCVGRETVRKIEKLYKK